MELRSKDLAISGTSEPAQKLGQSTIVKLITRAWPNAQKNANDQSRVNEIYLRLFQVPIKAYLKALRSLDARRKSSDPKQWLTQQMVKVQRLEQQGNDSVILSYVGTSGVGNGHTRHADDLKAARKTPPHLGTGLLAVYPLLLDSNPADTEVMIFSLKCDPAISPFRRYAFETVAIAAMRRFSTLNVALTHVLPPKLQIERDLVAVGRPIQAQDFWLIGDHEPKRTTFTPIHIQTALTFCGLGDLADSFDEYIKWVNLFQGAGSNLDALHFTAAKKEGTEFKFQKLKTSKHELYTGAFRILDDAFLRRHRTVAWLMSLAPRLLLNDWLNLTQEDRKELGLASICVQAHVYQRSGAFTSVKSVLQGPGRVYIVDVYGDSTSTTNFLLVDAHPAATYRIGRIEDTARTLATTVLIVGLAAHLLVNGIGSLERLDEILAAGQAAYEARVRERALISGAFSLNKDDVDAGKTTWVPHPWPPTPDYKFFTCIRARTLWPDAPRKYPRFYVSQQQMRDAISAAGEVNFKGTVELSQYASSGGTVTIVWRKASDTQLHKLFDLTLTQIARKTRRNVETRQSIIVSLVKAGFITAAAGEEVLQHGASRTEALPQASEVDVLKPGAMVAGRVVFPIAARDYGWPGLKIFVKKESGGEKIDYFPLQPAHIQLEHLGFRQTDAHIDWEMLALTGLVREVGVHLSHEGSHLAVRLSAIDSAPSLNDPVVVRLPYTLLQVLPTLDLRYKERFGATLRYLTRIMKDNVPASHKLTEDQLLAIAKRVGKQQKKATTSLNVGPGADAWGSTLAVIDGQPPSRLDELGTS
ncbi:hypothetical protein OC835_007036 [Tilletia horrida]|nr:hypothetical protein OC835_007036 [Tilletia horrida]